MATINDLSFLQSTEIMVPFLFTFAVTFGILEITKVFRNKGVNLIIALSLSIFAITSPTFVNLLWNYFGDITIFFIAMFLVAFVLEVFGLRGQIVGGGSMVLQSGVLFLLLTIGFYYTDRMPTLPFVGGGQNALFLFAIALILAIFWNVYKMQQVKS